MNEYRSKILLFTCSLLLYFNVFSQISYSGFIGKFPIEFVGDFDSDNYVRAIYMYKSNNTPIELKGSVKNGSLILSESNKIKKNILITIKDFNTENKVLKGLWTDLSTKKDLELVLNKKFEVSIGNDVKWKTQEMLQLVDLKKYYFKILFSKDSADYYPIIVGVEIIEKGTDKLFQQFDLGGEFNGFDNIRIGDYNFDGFEDFSVFEARYAGPNRSRIYFLYNPVTKKYFESGISGSSLEFDKKTRTILEHNQCCGGSIHVISKYKLVKNRMVLIEEHCYKWDEKKQKIIEQKMKNCR